MGGLQGPAPAGSQPTSAPESEAIANLRIRIQDGYRATHLGVKARDRMTVSEHRAAGPRELVGLFGGAAARIDRIGVLLGPPVA